jgi:hypothetical protein
LIQFKKIVNKLVIREILHENMYNTVQKRTKPSLTTFKNSNYIRLIKIKLRLKFFLPGIETNTSHSINNYKKSNLKFNFSFNLKLFHLKSKRILRSKSDAEHEEKIFDHFSFL